MDRVQMGLRVAQAQKKDLADARAMEKLAKKPQLAVFDNQPESLLSGGEAGMKRVIGAGKRRKAAPKKEDIEISELVEEGISGSVDEDTDAKEEGRKFARHLMEVQGAEFLKRFHEGLMDYLEEGGLEGGRVVPPGGVAPKAYGNVPQAPASFQRNSVSLDLAAQEASPAARRRGRGKAMPGTGPGAVPLPLAEPPTIPILKGAGASRSERAKMVSFLMKQKGMSLGEASKHIKAKGAKSLADLK